jgi:hypothetical protein
LAAALAAQLYPQLTAEFDNLGPVEFSKRVTDFGDYLSRHQNLTTAEKAAAFVKYAFLQDRLAFWMHYEPKSAIAAANLTSAASILYQGAVLAGVASPLILPDSYVRAGTTAMQYEGPSVRVGSRATVEPEEASLGVGSRRWADHVLLGGEAENRTVGIVWGRGIQDQGLPWERFLATLARVGKRLAAGAKVFDFFDKLTGRATSAKTLDTTTYSMAANPKQIFYRVKKYIDQMADYNAPRNNRPDIDPAEIKQKVLELAVPEYTSTAQREQLELAKAYGAKRGVLVMVTAVRDEPFGEAPSPPQGAPVGIGVRVRPASAPVAEMVGRQLGHAFGQMQQDARRRKTAHD